MLHSYHILLVFGVLRCVILRFVHLIKSIIASEKLKTIFLHGGVNGDKLDSHRANEQESSRTTVGKTSGTRGSSMKTVGAKKGRALPLRERLCHNWTAMAQTAGNSRAGHDRPSRCDACAPHVYHALDTRSNATAWRTIYRRSGKNEAEAREVKEGGRPRRKPPVTRIFPPDVTGL